MAVVVVGGGGVNDGDGDCCCCCCDGDSLWMAFDDEIDGEIGVNDAGIGDGDGDGDDSIVVDLAGAARLYSVAVFENSLS